MKYYISTRTNDPQSIWFLIEDKQGHYAKYYYGWHLSGPNNESVVRLTENKKHYILHFDIHTVNREVTKDEWEAEVMLAAI